MVEPRGTHLFPHIMGGRTETLGGVWHFHGHPTEGALQIPSTQGHGCQVQGGLAFWGPRGTVMGGCHAHGSPGHLYLSTSFNCGLKYCVGTGADQAETLRIASLIIAGGVGRNEP